jgi:acetyl-CoA synthetase
LEFISEAAVVGVPEATKGEVPYAFVILKEGIIESSEHKQLANQHVAKVIAKFAVPQGLFRYL